MNCLESLSVKFYLDDDFENQIGKLNLDSFYKFLKENTTIKTLNLVSKIKIRILMIRLAFGFSINLL